VLAKHDQKIFKPLTRTIFELGQCGIDGRLLLVNKSLYSCYSGAARMKPKRPWTHRNTLA